MALPRVHVLALGGTIAMTVGDDGALVPALSARDLLATLPSLGAQVHLTAESFRQVPGASLTLMDVEAVRRRAEEVTADGAVGVVVTQGTDTLEETAYLLDLMWSRPEPVVLTGAMRSAQAPGADGPANLEAAVLSAASAQMRDSGVTVVMDDQIHSAARVRKVRTSGPGAFVSPDSGPLGWVIERRDVCVLAQRNDRLTAPPADPGQLEHSAVALVPITLANDDRLLRHLSELGYHGVVIEAMGAGHIPHWLVGPLAALAAEVPVVLASRTGAGRIHRHTYGFAGSETDLLGRGLIPAGHLDGRKSRLLLTLLLAAGVPRDEIAQWFDRA